MERRLNSAAYSAQQLEFSTCGHYSGSGTRPGRCRLRYLLDREKNQSTGMTRAQQLNAWRKNEKAEFVFNEEDLESELRKAGFVDIWRLSAGASSIEIFRDCERHGSPDLVLERENRHR